MSRGSRTISIRLAIFALTLASLGGGCGSDSEHSNSATLSGNTPCERADSLASAKGCAPVAGCMIEPACADVSNAWLDCVARDLTQCLCEGDDNALNCEGSYKPDEGPARCINEAIAMEACISP